VLQGYSVRCVTAADRLLDLGGQETSRALEQRLRAYVKPRLVVIDELGYLTYDSRAADLLFQVISRRYERGSLLVTTNLAFKAWHTIFPNAACVVTIIDRLVHKAEILTIEGDSYRLKEARERAAQKTRARKQRTPTP
jgi:DNA replication protein DnaC